MNSTRDKAFLMDLAELLRRHGPNPFLLLANRLNDPGTREEIIRAVTDLANIAAQIQQRPSRSSRKPSRDYHAQIRSLIDSLQSSDPESADVISQLYDKISLQEMLPSRNDVLSFCQELGLDVPSGAPKARMLHTALRHLAKVSMNDLREALQLAHNRTRDQGQGYQRFVDAILRPSPGQRPTP